MTPNSLPVSSAAVSPNGAAGAAGRPGRPGRILIVDDRPDKLLTLEFALAPLEREIVKAGSGSDALRWLLRRDFAVVLLDVNMPGMDGFETARLIRLRRRNQDTPILFITSYGDEIHALEGYSLGAVDFILSPLVPNVLRSKVSVFLELHERTSEVKEQAQRWHRRTRQLQQLTRAALEIHAEFSIETALQSAVNSARDIIGVRQACAIVTAEKIGLSGPQIAVAPAPRLPDETSLVREIDLRQAVRELSTGMHRTAAELEASALGRLLSRGAPAAPASGLTAPLLGRDGNVFGVLLAAGKRDGAFTEDDEALLVQLAQIAATAVENTLFAEARESNRIKDEFLATLSHELRTPLSSILGWAQLLRTQMLDPEETADALEIIEQNAAMQCKLIEDLLDVSRIVTGKMQFNVRPIDLAAVVRAAVNVMLPAAQAKQVQIHLTLDENAVCVNGDPDRLQQALWNVVSNAVKFTPPQGQIAVRLAAVGQDAQISVTDDGEGIAPEFLPYIFDRFRQADSGTSRKHGGLGIGLAIVRHVIELHGGSVRAESEGQGRGTTITVTLPLERVEPGITELPQPGSEDSVDESEGTNAATEPVFLN